MIDPQEFIKASSAAKACQLREDTLEIVLAFARKYPQQFTSPQLCEIADMILEGYRKGSDDMACNCIDVMKLTMGVR